MIARTCAATLFWSPDLLTAARYCIIILTDSVLPAPDSPETRMLWLQLLGLASRIFVYASSAIA